MGTYGKVLGTGDLTNVNPTSKLAKMAGVGGADPTSMIPGIGAAGGAGMGMAAYNAMPGTTYEKMKYVN